MSVNPKSLATVIDLARRGRDEAGTRVTKAKQELAGARAQLDQLTHYAQDGQEKWLARSATGVSTALMQHQRDFAQKIQHAVDFQAGVIAKHEERVGAALTALQVAERELATLEKVAQRALTEQRLAQHKAEQKLNDEMAMSMQAYQRRQAEQESTQ